MSEVISIPRAISDIAAVRPDDPALIIDGEPFCWSQFDELSSIAAAVLIDAEVEFGDLVAVASRNDVDFFISVLACYKAGSIPMPISSRLTAPERSEIFAVAKPRVIVGFDGFEGVSHSMRRLDGSWAKSANTNPFISRVRNELDVVSPSWKAPTSGGSTGRPKVIIATDCAAIDRSGTAGMLMRKSGRVCIPGPMYHNGPFSYAVRALAFGNTIVTSSQRFTAESTLRMAERSQAYWMLLVPTMMHRILRDPARFEYSLESLEFLWHVGAKCPEWVKEEWIRWLGPKRICELYAGTEAQAITSIRGDDWLKHRGSVGRVTVGEMSVRGEDSELLPSGVVGEIFMRPTAGRLTYHYIGAAPKAIDGGWESLGDLGYFDADGYLYISDRLTDMIVTGGANVYPAEVESAIEELPGVTAAVVVGIPDDEFGSVVAAVVQVDHRSGVTEQHLAEGIAMRLARYKIPRRWRLITTNLRDDAGKVRRSMWKGAFAEGDAREAN